MPLTKRESQIDQLRLATVVAATDVVVVGTALDHAWSICNDIAGVLTDELCVFVVLTRDKLIEFQASVDESVRETINLTMGATTTKNLATLPFLQVNSP